MRLAEERELRICVYVERFLDLNEIKVNIICPH